MFRPWEEKRARLSAAECQSRSAQGVGSATTVLSAPSATALQSLRSQSAARAGGPSRWRAMDEHRQGISSAGAHSARCQGDPSYSASSYSSAKAVKQERKNLTINEVAKWLLIVGGSMAEILGVAPWLREFHAEIELYRDPPKSLEELQDAVSRPAPGYEIHHIVEQKSAGDDPRVHTPENLVRIPTLKHRQINGWYGRKNHEYPPNPRQRIRGWTWEQRREFGLKALIDHGVLKP